ncbi:MAG: ATP-binding protein [Amaricoccus sp.]|uniref:ATP-binding protein n=1 Tax=Amaricoccus sp. TaxID=1872485 RepID=UPI0039E6F7C3
MAGWIWDFLSIAGFQPHGFCLLWRPDVLWLHVVSDAVIAVAFFSIPAAILTYAWRRPDVLRGPVPFLFATFIVACGLTHLMSIWTLWMPDHGVEGLLKAATAVISILTAVLLWPAMPGLRAIPSPRQLADGNRLLAAEIAERRRAEHRMAELNDELERRVSERTACLAHANKELREARARADEANRAKSAFLAAMSHEIRTPMNGVLGMLGLVQRDGLDEDQRHYLAVAEESAHGLLSIINDILDYSRLDAGAVVLEETTFSPATVVQKVADLLREGAERKGLVLDVELAPDLPDEVIGDPHRLRQVLINLVGNAIKFTEEGGIRVRLERGGAGTLACMVQDSGLGIAPELQGCLFDRFTQGRDIARRHGGSGLGLAISRALVELMGGELMVESTPGVGSTFRFTIACRDSSDALVAPVADPVLLVVPETAPAGPRMGPARVLVVEDNAVNQLLVSKLLTRAGHEATIAADGEAALAHLRSRPFDVVLMDVQLPGMDGITVTRALRELASPACNLPVIALTANAMAGDRDRYLAAGMDDYVSKPIVAADLFAAIARQLDRSSAEEPRLRIA